MPTETTTDGTGAQAMSARETLKQKLGLTDADFAKPLPQPTAWSKPFWDGAKAGRLLLKTCLSCGHVDHPPYPFCTACGSEESEWRVASGRGELQAYAINMHSVPVPFIEDIPFVLALIDIPEGPRLISNIVDVDFKELRKGMQLEVVFRDAGNGFVLPKWRPNRAAGA
jgi:uncharacterized OB-fold protein